MRNWLAVYLCWAALAGMVLFGIFMTFMRYDGCRAMGGGFWFCLSLVWR